MCKVKDFVPKMGFEKNVGGALSGQREIVCLFFVDLVGMCVRNSTEIASCVHDLGHLFKTDQSRIFWKPMLANWDGI